MKLSRPHNENFIVLSPFFEKNMASLVLNDLDARKNFIKLGFRP
jgi:hypothetical protein